MGIISIKKQYSEETQIRLNNTSQLKMFNILKDSVDREKFLNIFRSYNVNDSAFDNERLYDQHEIEETDFFDNLSYKYYNSDGLWWVIAMTNKIVNPFEELEPGQSIKILKPNHVYKILKEVGYIGSL